MTVVSDLTVAARIAEGEQLHERVLLQQLC